MKIRNVFFLVLIALPVLLGSQVVNSSMPTNGLLAQNTEGISSSGKVYKEVLVNSGLSIVMENFDFEMDFYIIDFEVSAVKQGYVVSERWKTSGVKPAKNYAKFNKNQREMLSRLKKGDKVTIENIVVQGTDGTTRQINPITLKIK